MLVFSRKPGQSFIIGDDIEVVIFGFDNQCVKVGVRAPRHVPILRKELQEIEQQNAKAVDLPSDARIQKLSRELLDLLANRRKVRWSEPQ
jgi:carbon storage regulator